ncbi:MAG: VWA domain-containing protein [Gemmatimonadetes bacterium]|nr:VWA domain-containing protein [Gemmatimonadota bacterium]
MEQSEIDATAKMVKMLTKQFSVAKDGPVNAQLFSAIENAERKIRRRVQRDNPFAENELVLQESEKEFESSRTATVDKIERDFRSFRELAYQTSSEIGETYWLAELDKLRRRSKENREFQSFVEKGNLRESETRNPSFEKLTEDHTICRKLLLQEWRKLLDKEFSRWELETIRESRERLLQELGKWLRNLQQLFDTLNDLSPEPGLLFDLSLGSLSLSDVAQLKRWAEYLAKNKGVRELCDMMGRLRRAEKAHREELVKSLSMVTEYVPDINSNEEIVGITFDNVIERALPQELGLLADESTAILFDIKFVEGQLMCFDMEGLNQVETEIEEERLMQVSTEEKLGPIVICVDTSGSMGGSPEIIAKAVTLYMATRAISQKRYCLLINFSTEIETLDLSGKVGISKVIEFLGRSFHGGTDVAPALSYALDMMEKQAYQKSDLLVISDFIMDSLSDSLFQKIHETRENENRLYSLSIGNLFLGEGLKQIFENQWVYNPADSTLNSIPHVVETVLNT